jgi:hypothetical protein
MRRTAAVAPFLAVAVAVLVGCSTGAPRPAVTVTVPTGVSYGEQWGITGRQLQSSVSDLVSKTNSNVAEIECPAIVEQRTTCYETTLSGSTYPLVVEFVQGRNFHLVAS